MTLQLEGLDGRTGELMLDEVDSDVRDGRLYMSPHPKRHAQVEGTAPRHERAALRPAVPRDASTLLAEAEFNRFYLRALVTRAEQDGISAASGLSR